MGRQPRQLLGLTGVALVGLLCALRASDAQDARVLVFDFGTRSSPLLAGASRVEANDPRWTTAGRINAVDNPGLPDRLWTNDLTRDAITGDAEAAFRFEAAPGNWTVWVKSGIGGQWPSADAEYWSFDVSVGGAAQAFRFPSPYGEGPFFVVAKTYHVVSNGHIEVRISPQSRWALEGIVAWPDTAAEAGRATVSSLLGWAPPEEMAKWQEDPAKPVGAAPPLSAADQARGYYVWHRHWTQPVYPGTNPTAAELNPRLQATAVPGQYVPLTFTVRPLRPIAAATVTVDPLGPITAADIEVRKVGYMRLRPTYTAKYRYRLEPDVLVRWNGGELPAEVNATFWLTVHVPPGATPGLRSWQVRFTADGQTVSLPVELRILDAQLPDDPRHSFGIYYNDPVRRVPNAADEVSKQYWRRKSELEHQDLAAHGFRNVVLNTPIGAVDAQGVANTQSALAELDTEIGLAEVHGFQAPYLLMLSTSVYTRHVRHAFSKKRMVAEDLPPDGYYQEIGELVRTVEAERVRRHWPELIYYPVDEPVPSPGMMTFLSRLFGAIRAAGGKVAVTCPSPAAYGPVAPLVDVWVTSAFTVPAEQVAANPQAQYWCYPNYLTGGAERNAAQARNACGFWFMKSGYQRMLPYIYQSDFGDPYNYLDGAASEWLVRSEPTGEPVPVILWEAMREGTYDARYLAALEAALAAGRRAGLAEGVLGPAQKVRDEVYSRASGDWTPVQVEAARERLGLQLERLQKLLRG